MPSVIARNIGLVHPPLESFPSGGNVYDRKLLEHAGRNGFPLASLPTWRDDALAGGHWDLLVWDSLFLDRLARIAGERTALLLHYLPSLEPALAARKQPALQAVEQRAVSQADFVIATGRPVADAVTARWPGKPVFLCEPGVDQAFLLNRRDRTDRAVWLLTVGNLLPAKGHVQLLDILQRLRHLRWHWQVVGDGSRSPDTASLLRDRAAQAGLADRMTLHGALPQEAVAALMANSDVLVLPSTFESYGMAMAEAAAACLPVLGNRVGAAEQLIRHGVTGLLASPGDWDSFGSHLQTLLEDAALRAVFRGNLRHAPVRGWDRTFAEFRAACVA
jgi:glycosyltransferase involved in cell wall biosynthesis